MRLSWKDAWSTLLVVLGLTLALSVTQGWNWPLLGGVREGIIALVILGLGAHLFGAPRERFYFTDPFAIMTMVIVVGTMAIAIVGGLITGSVQYLVALMLVIIMLWAFATLRHAVEGRSTSRRVTPA
jgi:hypothetical protein